MKREKGANFVRQSYAGAVRQRLVHIERSIAYGARQEAVRQELLASGFDASLGTFRKSLWRARRWWRAQIVAAQSNQHITPLAAAPQVLQAPVTSDQPKTTAFQTPSPQPAQTKTPHHKPTTSVDVDAFFKRKSVFAKP